MIPETLTNFQRFQLEKYGNILVDNKPVTIEEFENRAAEIERDEVRINQHYELQLLSYQ